MIDITDFFNRMFSTDATIRGIFYSWRRRSIPSPRRWRGCGAFLTVLLHYVCKTYSLSNQAITDCERFECTSTPSGIKNTPCGAFFIPGGDEGIRTLDTVARIPHFQCGALDQLCDVSVSGYSSSADSSTSSTTSSTVSGAISSDANEASNSASISRNNGSSLPISKDSSPSNATGVSL